MADEGWIIESIVQFTHSPLWRTPIDNFIDDNCFLFSDDAEMKVEQTEVHLAFRKLADDLITAFVEELGVPLETVLEVVHRYVNGQTPLQQPAEQFLSNMFYMDDFRSFHKMMLRRNIQLDILASRALQRQQEGLSGEASPEEEAAMDEEEALRLAIKASLEDETTARRMMELEDVQIQEALALSIAAEEERARRERGGTARDGVKKEATEVEMTGVEHAVKENLNNSVEEKENVIEKLEARALEVRKETLMRSVGATQKLPPSSLDVHPAGQVHATAAASNQQPEAPSAPASATAKPPAKNVAPPPPVPHAKGIGFKTLPSIQPSFKQLETVVMGTATPPAPQPGKQPVNTPAPAVSPPTLEEMEERARHMREQREKILMRNKANREKELNDYSAGGVKAKVKPSSIQEGHKQMTLELARRLREDIVREATK
ncbi:putative coiled-coil domain-containing protein 104 [Trypanosoma conorhini]|uniref:Cilia- and flagella-associated protein 36 n=1 Tax=Trypanosoma conorhini TaxID=83891 RepID=A0A422Q288_9TRYP|nr:putative coiled-coil domain-containing protein 104 [Trypanosoma conorhini]RNF24076.1 putative coiled-coil domain-containing protein 104 [Trypanosoma conorhini]